MPLKRSTPVVTTSLARQISEEIRQAIVAGEVRSDERLPSEDELARRYGVSRPTIREALKRLAAQNLIRSRRGPQGGNFVNCPDPAEIAQSLSGAVTLMVSLGAFDLDEIAVARYELGTVCCRLAVANISENHLVAMQNEVERQLDHGISDEEFCASDVSFHRELTNATGNQPLRFIMVSVVEVLMPITNMVISRVRDRKMIATHHARLLDRLRDRDADACVSEYQELMRYLQRRYDEARTAREARAARKDKGAKAQSLLR